MAGRSASGAEVFLVFLKLGLTSFGGPIAHLGYFRAELVVRRRWLDERAYADLVGLCQFLPGPASSQAGLALGLLRAGWLGGIAAWVGFTLPSALLMTLFAYAAPDLSASLAGAGILHGLKLVAVAVVAQAVLGMAHALCPDRERAAIATAAAMLSVFAPTAVGQVGAIALGSLVGSQVCRATGDAVGLTSSAERQPPAMPISRATGVSCLALFAALLVLLPLVRRLGDGAALFAAFYRSGALVFGGGHVVLPLLREAVVTPGWVPDATFLAGYGAMQAMPGPLFTLAAYLGAEIPGSSEGIVGAIVALGAIFMPGFLILLGALPFWHLLRAHRWAQAAMRGANAAVVGLLGAALYDPVWLGAVQKPSDFALALLCFVSLTSWRLSPLLVVALGVSGGICLAA